MIRGEITADCIGIRQAPGCCDATLAKKVSGIDGGSCRVGGRLENYVENREDLPRSCKTAEDIIGRITEKTEAGKPADCWETLSAIQDL